MPDVQEPTVRNIETPRLLKKVGQPDQKEPPDRIGHKPCDNDRPRLPMLKQAEPMDFPCALTVSFVPIALNVSQFVRAKTLLTFRLVVQRKPEK